MKPEGLLNQLLFKHRRDRYAAGNPQHPTRAIFIGIVYSYLPFMVLPIYASLEKMDYSLIEAALDLGCRPIAAFWKITFPLALPGVAAGCLLVFIPAVGEFVIPDLLGGSQTLMIGKTLWTEFFANRDCAGGLGCGNHPAADPRRADRDVPAGSGPAHRKQEDEGVEMNATWSRFSISFPWCSVLPFSTCRSCC